MCGDAESLAGVTTCLPFRLQTRLLTLLGQAKENVFSTHLEVRSNQLI